MYASSMLDFAVMLLFSTLVLPGLAETNTHCGGVLKVGLDSPATINCKLNGECDNREQCVWTIRVEGKEADGLRFLEGEGNFELGYDFLQLIAFDGNAFAVPSETRTLGKVHEQEDVTMTGAHFVFVTFSTDDSSAGAGFSLEIEAVEGSSDGYVYKYDDFFSDTPVGNTTLRPYVYDMFTAFVITANNVDSLELGVKFDIEKGFDGIYVFHLERNGGGIILFPYGLLSGSGSRYFTVRSYTTFVLVFRSADQQIVVREGIELDWRQER